MADNLGYSEGAGKIIAADDVSSVFYQRVKLDAGGDGLAVPVLAGTGTAASALRVALADSSTLIATVASAGIASGAIASGAIASGAIASGAIAAGAFAAGATSIADNEDAASADGDRAIKILFKRKDSPANSSGTDLDYEQPQMSAGRIWTSSTIDAALPAGTAAGCCPDRWRPRPQYP